ncbi:MAG: chemotaxis-specific protein-glutamate methyltransferase CheB [Caulobacteraceae bacterium]
MTRVLVVDDSALVRRLLRQLLADEAGFETAFAADGEEALAQLRAFRPDVVTLDINLPRMDGLTCLDRIMLERPTPVIVFSSLTAEGAAASVEALALGAVDVLQKPSGPLSLGMSDLGAILIEKVRAAQGVRLRGTHRLVERVRTLTRSEQTPDRRPRRSPLSATAEVAPRAGRLSLVLVGCSTGGPPALDALLAPLPASFPCPIVVAQHMPATFTGPLARRLDGICRLEVAEVTQPTPLESGCVYVGRGDADVVISARAQGLLALPSPSSVDYAWHPSVDRLAWSALEALPAPEIAGVLMTGMGGDGAEAMSALRARGGWTIAEAEETAVVWGMPGALVRMGGAAEVAPLDELAARLAAFAGAR